MNKSIIKIKDISFKYGEKKIFDGLDLDIYEGMFTTIVGRNGSGKTTFAKLLAGIYKADGYISIDGYLLNDSFIDKIRRIFGFCFNDTVFFDSIRDCLAFPLESLQYTKDEINITLDRLSKKFGIDKILDCSFNDITLSEKIKVLLGASLINNPKIILIDDLFRGLSVSDKKIVLRVLNEYRKEYGLTIILLTSDLEDTLYSDRVIAFDKGKCVIDGAPKEVYRDDLLEKYGFCLPFIVKLSHNLILYNLLDEVYLKDREVLDKLWP